MKSVFAQSALIGGEWRSNVRLSFQQGLIQSIESGVSAAPGDEQQRIVIPGMPNLHSHAFQRGMAGLAEIRGPGADSFWSWRTIMYRFALSMTPDDVEAVAAQLYMEMLEAGYTRVGEFHYLHHDRDGGHYANIAEMAARIAAASSETGIGLTLLPVFYAHSGFGGGEPADGQRRFINSLDSFADLLSGCASALSPLANANLGIAPHSLRAATPDELKALIPMAAKGPLHIHIAEQTKEVEDCIAWSGARPVSWLLDHHDIDERWCLIHATHMDDNEVSGMARSGAIAGLCPITEANLGDGTFSATEFLRYGGRYGVGSDSNISISVAHELRQLEYSQRLHLRSRNVIAEPGQSTGSRLFLESLKGGAQALQWGGDIAVGGPADFVSLDCSRVSYLADHQILDQWIFADGVGIDGVWTGGEKLVTGGRHQNRDHIAARFQSTMTALLQS